MTAHMPGKGPARILLFTPQLFPATGGFSRVLDVLASGMGSYGFEMRVLAPTKKETHLLPYSLTPVRFFHHLYPLIKDYYSRYERIMALNLEMLYQTHGFDLIHAHLAYPAGYCAARWGRKKKIPVIISCHGHDLYNIADKPYNQDTWKQFQRKMSEGFQLADAITVPSRSMACELKKQGVESVCIPHGVHLKDIPQESSGREKEPFILAIGRMNKAKGFDLLFEAFTILSRRNRNIRLIVFGEGCGTMHFFSQTLASELKGKVSFVTTGGDEQKKWDLLKQCELYVCSSRMEGFGLAVLEAMACSKPVVAFKTLGVSDLVHDGKNGKLVDLNDTHAMAEAIEQIIDDPALAKKMSEASGKLAACYDWPIILEQYQHLYRDIWG